MRNLNQIIIEGKIKKVIKETESGFFYLLESTETSVIIQTKANIVPSTRVRLVGMLSGEYPDLIIIAQHIE
jgi:hypothetical protein